MNAKDPLWSFSQSEFRRSFKILLSTLCCDECKFSPASLRAGGATFLFDQCSDIGRLRLMGWWASMQSLEHYIQVGKSQQLLQELNKKCMLKIKTILRDEAIQQIDSALAPTQVTHGQASTEPFPMGLPITKQDYFLHAICLLLGTIFGRHYRNAPFLARNP